MKIGEIKSRLGLQTVLNHYHLIPDKNNRLICPWHDDKTPSLQVYPNTNSWTCFSSNCQAGSGDQIDMIRLQEQCTEHEAILKAKVLAGHQIIVSQNGTEKKVPTDDRIMLLSRAFNFYTNALKQTKSAVAYLESRKLWNGLSTPMDIGFNGGRFHYRGKLIEAEKQSWIDLGMIKAIGSNQYRSWAKDCIIFPLKNHHGQIISFYGRSVTADKNPHDGQASRHFYHKDRQGLYPHYPKPGVKQIILTESVIDAASLIMADIPTQEMGVLACYGTKGLMAEHIEAINKLEDLREVIFFFDGDQAGIEAVDKYSKQLVGLNRSLIISKVNTPEGEDINSLHVAHEVGIFGHLIESRTVLIMADSKATGLFSFNGNNGAAKMNGQSKEPKSQPALPAGKLKTDHPEHIIYEADTIKIHIWGGIDQSNLGRLKVSLHIQRKDKQGNSFRDEVNLYSFSQVKRIISHISEALEISSNYVSEVLADLTRQLEAHRASKKQERAEKKVKNKTTMTAAESKAAMSLLKSPNLMRKTLHLIEQSGLVGQQKNGMLLFLLYLSRYFDEPLHAIIFGKSGSGKTYLQTKISECVPPEDIRVVTSLTENTLYYSPKDFWKHKILIIEDLEGVYQAFLPLREMMSKQEISKFTTDKDSQGNNIQKLLKVVGPVCVSGATTQTWIYEDNANRCFLLVIGESQDHLEAVMTYQRKKYAGLIDTSKQEKAKQKLQNAQRLLRPIKVVNPYSQELILPEKIFKKLRTNTHYLELIKIITFYCQYSKEIKIDNGGHKYIEASIEDIEWANRLVKESLLRKSDELNDKLRSFFETLKAMMRSKKQSERSFYARQIRQLRMNPMTVNRHLRDLDMRGYISQIGGNQKTGYEYQIELWDEYEGLQKGIDQMDENLEKIRVRVAEKKLKAQKREV